MFLSRSRQGLSWDDLIGAGQGAGWEEGSGHSSRRGSQRGGIAIPGASTRRNSSFQSAAFAPSPQSSSAALTSTPQSASSYSDPTSFATNTTSVTTPSTSYTGPPVPHPTPIVSPSSLQLHTHTVPNFGVSPVSSSVGVAADDSTPSVSSSFSSSAVIISDSEGTPDAVISVSPRSYTGSVSRRTSSSSGRVAEQGQLRRARGASIASANGGTNEGTSG
jgi:hypothetical protein